MLTMWAFVSAVVMLLGENAVSSTYTKLVCELETMSISCSQHERISINYAHFGRKSANICPNPYNANTYRTNCTGQEESFTAVRNRCQNKRSCSVAALTTVLGDPCIYVPKYLKVGYSCVPGSSNVRIACEWETINLSCPVNKKLTINEATFGRTQPTPCYSRGQYIGTNTCQTPNATAIMSSLCDGKQTCSTPVGTHVFSDPCPGVSKFLEVKFVCS